MLHNPGTAAAHRPALFPEGQLIMLDDSDRPMWSLSLQEATLSALQPDQIRAFVPFD